MGTLPGGPEVKASACNECDPGSILGLGRYPREGNGNPLQYSCLENPMDREAWWATVHGVTKSQTRLSDVTYLLTLYFRKPTKTVLSVDMYFPSLLFRGVFSRNAAKQLCI